MTLPSCLCLHTTFSKDFSMWKYLKGYRLAAAAAPVMKLLEALLELCVPIFVARVIDDGIKSGSRADVIKYCALIALFGLVGMLFAVTSQMLSARTAVGFSTALRSDALKHILALSNEESTGIGRSAMITRLGADIDRVQSGINMGLRLLLRSPFIVFGSVIMAGTIDRQMLVLFLVTVAVLAVIVFAVIAAGIPLQKKTGSRLDALTAHTDDNLRGVRVIRAFGREEGQKEIFANRNAAHSRASVIAGTVSSFMNPMTFAVINVAVIIIISRGSGMVETGRLTQGQVVALYNYMAQILTELVKLANLTFTLSRAVASGQRVSALLKTEPERTGGDSPAPCGEPVIELRNVSYRYPGAGADSISGVSFALREGESLGIIGGTGSGKSTLALVCAAINDPSSGEIYYYGKPSSELSPAETRKIISLVPQKATLFSGTVRDNMLRGSENAGEDEILSALDAAEALGFVEAKDGGLDAEVSRAGSNFSGGQRQRLTIARALIRRPRLLILDDSFSALDYKTDLAVREKIASLSFPHATVIVSQRPSTVMNCDRILVLEDGRAAGLGSHKELLASCPLYREIYNSQYGGEE